jgi:hypothetical protein
VVVRHDAHVAGEHQVGQGRQEEEAALHEAAEGFGVFARTVQMIPTVPRAVAVAVPLGPGALGR